MKGIPITLKCRFRKCMSLHVERLGLVMSVTRRLRGGQRWHPMSVRCAKCGREWLSTHPDSGAERRAGRAKS